MQESFHLSDLCAECHWAGSHIPSWSLFLLVFPKHLQSLSSPLTGWSTPRWVSSHGSFLSPFLMSPSPKDAAIAAALASFPGSISRADLASCRPAAPLPPEAADRSVQCVTVQSGSSSWPACCFPRAKRYAVSEMYTSGGLMGE